VLFFPFPLPPLSLERGKEGKGKKQHPKKEKKIKNKEK
jgi:hypothetical protein